MKRGSEEPNQGTGSPLATDPAAPLHREHRQLCQTTLALLRLLKSIKNISPLCSEHSVEVSFQRGKIMACFLFHSELISACLVILNHAGFPATNILYLAMLRVVSQAASIS